MKDLEASHRRKRRAGIIGAVAGIAAAGIAAGVTAEKFLINKARKDPNDPYIDEPFGKLPADRIRTVDTPDGIPLHVEIDETQHKAGDSNREHATVVFVHGYCLDMGTFHFQRRSLRESALPVRAVYYDQPGHGQSGRIGVECYSMDSLADALYSVIRQTVQTGPIVLVGHSMGAMTIMAFARKFPELFHSRVSGAVFMSTSAGGLDQVTFGAPRVLSRAQKVFLPALGKAAAWTPGAIDRARLIVGDLAWLLTRRYGFATDKPSPSVVSFVEEMNTRTPIQTVVGFSSTLLQHNEYEALPALADMPILICCGSDDQFTPASHTMALADALPNATLVMIPNAGHIAQLERPDEVTKPMMAMLKAVTDSITDNKTHDKPVQRKTWRRKKKPRTEPNNA